MVNDMSKNSYRFSIMLMDYLLIWSKQSSF